MLANQCRMQSTYLGSYRSLQAGVLHTGPRRVRTLRARASAKAEEALNKGNVKYKAGDRLQAMKLYEDALNEGPTPEQRLRALYGVTAVHAAFGDIELAKMTLREAVGLGMDYETATIDPDNVEIVASPQMIIQLKRFANQVRTGIENRRSAGAAPSKPRVAADLRDLDAIIGSSSSEQAGVDTSIPAILRRVALLLIVGVGLGVGLFYLGLEYLFPKIE